MSILLFHESTNLYSMTRRNTVYCVLFSLLIRQVHGKCGIEAQAGFFVDAAHKQSQTHLLRKIYFFPCPILGLRWYFLVISSLYRRPSFNLVVLPDQLLSEA